MLSRQPLDRRRLGVVLSSQLGQAQLSTGGVLVHDLSSIERPMPNANDADGVTGGAAGGWSRPGDRLAR